jgi:RNA polymerase sigma factor (sigma-70 family)
LVVTPNIVSVKPELPTASMPDRHDSWFIKEVQPHAPSLRAYLRHSFPSVNDVDDVIQESFLRIWKRRLADPILSSRAFLFTIARNLALDLVRRGRISPIMTEKDFGAMNVVEDGQNAADVADANERIHALADAVSALPARCREIIILRKFKGLSQREVAEHFRISERTVEAQVARGIKRCESHLRRRGITSFTGHEK